MLAVEASEEGDDSTSDTSDDSSDSNSGTDSDSDDCDSCVDDASDGDGDREDKKSTSDSELHERSSFNVPSNQPRRVPKLALVNKHFRGATPIELSRLTRVELSMVSLVNCIYTLTMLKRGCHWGSTATVFSVLNDVNAIAEHLPRMPSLGDIALIRSSTDSTSPREFLYSPHNVIRALMWLEDNNFLWENKFKLPEGDEWAVDHAGCASREGLEIEHIPADEEDFEGLDADLNGSSGPDGHAVNPNAPPSNMTDVLLTGSQENVDILRHVEKIVSKKRSVMTRASGDYVRDYETERFLQLSFVNLFPYGRGGPEPNGSFKVSASYLRHLLCLGCQREFQQSPNFIFYAYSWQMKNKASTISYLATRNGETEAEPVNITVAEAREFVDHIERNRNRMRTTVNGLVAPASTPASLITETKLRLLLNRLQPYTEMVPGTEMYMMGERKKLLAMISSQVTTNNAMWGIFFTEAQPDMYLPEIYDNAVTSARSSAWRLGWNASMQDRRQHSDILNKTERAEMLRDHPLLSARIHAAQQMVFWREVIQGLARPFGKVKDFWRRVEFQEKGTPHSHNLICIETSANSVNEDSLLETGNVEVDASNRAKVLKRVQEISTASLQPRAEDDFSDLSHLDAEAQAYIIGKEEHYNYCFDRTMIADAYHPARERFSAESKDFSYDKKTGNIPDSAVQKQFRRMQLANQMHACRKSCFKYCRPGEALICRYDRGNQDVQYLATKSGGAEYVSKYASKTDTAECKALLNAVFYQARGKTAVISLSPHIPMVESSERACYAILLLHTKWDNGETAESRYHYLKSLESDHPDSLPSYVTRSVSRRVQSESILADTGNADFNATATVEEFSELLGDEDEENVTTQYLPLTSELASTAPDSTMPDFQQRVLYNCPVPYLSFLNQFIPGMRQAKKDGHVSYNQCTEDEMRLKESNATAIVPIRDIDVARDELDASVASLNSEQLRAYHAATHYISGEHGGQLIMFLSGEGGTGKSRLISDLTKYTQILYGKTVGYFGSVLKTAPTGGAAFNIKGHTWHSALGKSTKNLNGTVLFVLDEISLLSLENLSEISHRLCVATGNFRKPFGGLHTILAGDFYQMKTISGTSIVEPNPKTPEGRDGRAIWLKLTHFVQLTINVRAQSSNGESEWVTLVQES
eukprot:gene22621-28758_t